MVYTAEEVDEVIVMFERRAAKQRANKDAMVKRKAAERDLMKTAEAARDLLQDAPRGDKQQLADVFGGDCQRFWRIKNVLDGLDLTEASESDQRWKDLRAAIETIEEILKQLGIYRRWKVQPPEKISYEDVPPALPPLKLQRFKPEVVGCEADTLSWSVDPSLPPNLNFDSHTGEICGRVKAGLTSDTKTYVVTASNSAGSAQADVIFAICAVPPSGLSYRRGKVCYVGEPVRWPAHIEKGTAEAFSITPALPRGLTLDEKTGLISGTPARKQDAAEFTIVAENSGGRCECVLEFDILDAPPTGLEYPDCKGELPYGGNVYFIPEVKLGSGAHELQRKITTAVQALSKPTSKWGRNYCTTGMYVGTKWGRARSRAFEMLMLRGLLPELVFSVAPELPDGLHLAKTTGVISGRPNCVTKGTVYRVTVKNDSGEAVASVNFSVTMQAPKALSYPEAQNLIVGKPVSMTPEVEGLVEKWEVEPELPPGLQLDPDMGSITGIPSGRANMSTWTVTAKNEAGQVSTKIRFGVQQPAPSSFVYPSNGFQYPVGRFMELLPMVEGHIDQFSVAPDLPGGICLDEQTGRISGTPTEMCEQTSYVVMAKNEAGFLKTVLDFEVSLLPPSHLEYPRVDDVYEVGEAVFLEPSIEGGATSWSLTDLLVMCGGRKMDGILPEGLHLDLQTGVIEGTFSKSVEEASYTVTASNEAGGTSAVLTFEVAAAAPQGLTYPEASSELVVGRPLHLEAHLKAGGQGATFSVEPSLPEGLELDASTGAINGAPAEAKERGEYRVAASNESGRAEAVLSFACVLPSADGGVARVTSAFAASLEDVTCVEDLPKEPPKGLEMSDWMVWMVHRAWLNDPSLDVFDFTCLQMPLPHLEPRIAPKLMKAMATNTYIRSLLLADSNLRAPQAHQLAEALRSNSTLQVLNLESNYLDGEAIRSLMISLTGSPLHTVRLANQVGHQMFGRSIEQFVAEMMRANKVITKLGFDATDPHWANVISVSLLRNVDLARRRRKGLGDPVDEATAEQRDFVRLRLQAPPEAAAWEIFEDDDARVSLLRIFVAEKHHVPTNQQLQAFAKSHEHPLPYSAVAPLNKAFRGKLLDTMVGKEVELVDSHQQVVSGTLQAWTEKNERWNLEVVSDDGAHFNFRSERQPAIDASEQVASWLRP